MLEQGRKKEKDQDPRRSLSLPIRTEENEGEREGEGEAREFQQQEEEEEEQPLQGFQLHHIHQNWSSYFSSSSPSVATASSSGYAHLPERIGEGHGHHSLGSQLAQLHHQHHQQREQQLQRPPSRSRYGGARGGAVGEIVEVQGGHIVRSTGRKDRHSKVCTAKGPRDRRVRLSAHTAIQFYDVQDRLGYDRPSKAVDWLMKNAKAAIDELAELPPWSPSATIAAAHASSSSRPPPPPNQSSSPEQALGESSKKPTAASDPVVSTTFTFGRSGGAGGSESTSFLPPSFDTDSIADTIKSFFPVAAATATPPSSSPSIGFQTYSPDLPSQTSSQAQDLRLSLQSFQNPIFHHPESSHQHHHHHHHSQYHQSPTPSTHNAHLSSTAQLAFDAASASWAEQSQRIAPWNVVEPSGGGGGYLFSFPPPQAPPPPHSVQGLFFSQRGPLQSSNSPVVRNWADPVDATADHRMQPTLHPSMMSSIGFASGAGFSGFRIPARFQGEEEHDGLTDKPPSASRH